jgi:hypothetical protein
MTPKEMVREYWNIRIGPDPEPPPLGPLTIEPPPAPAKRIPGWLILASTGLVAWWFLR